MTIPALMLALGLPTFVGFAYLLANSDSNRPKAFDLDGWDNGKATRP